MVEAASGVGAGPLVKGNLAAPWDGGGRVVVEFRAGAPVGPELPEVPMCMVSRAVAPLGVSGREWLAPDAHLDVLGALPRPWVTLTHAGPRAGDVLVPRPVGPVAAADPVHGRTPQALDDEGWDEVVQAFVQQGRAVVDAGAWAVGVEAARGHLWHAALSPLTNGGRDPSAAMARLQSVVRALAGMAPRVFVSLVVEDVAVGGWPAAQGVAAARALVASGAGALVVRTGGPHMAARMEPGTPPHAALQGPSVLAARWVRQAVAVPVLAAGGLGRSSHVLRRVVDTRAADGVVTEWT